MGKVNFELFELNIFMIRPQSCYNSNSIKPRYKMLIYSQYPTNSHKYGMNLGGVGILSKTKSSQKSLFKLVTNYNRGEQEGTGIYLERDDNKFYIYVTISICSRNFAEYFWNSKMSTLCTFENTSNDHFPHYSSYHSITVKAFP